MPANLRQSAADLPPSVISSANSGKNRHDASAQWSISAVGAFAPRKPMVGNFPVCHFATM
jgi:hypothetical protein